MIETMITDFASHEASILALRDQVFTQEQGVDPELDVDGLDDDARHAVVYQGDICVGVGRILADGHIGRIAVRASHRTLGVGTKIIAALMAEAQTTNASRVYLGSQVQARGFYEKLGFKVCSDIFMDAEIEHVEMEIRL